MRCDWFSQYENVYNTRSAGQRIFNVPFARSNQCMGSIIRAGPKPWNNLPLEIKKYSSYATSKCKLKSHLCDRASDQVDQDPLSAKKYPSKILAAYQRRYFHALTLAQAPLLYEINSDSGSGDTFTAIQRQRKRR